MKGLIASAAAAAVLAGAGSAQGAVTVIGGGQAEACSKAALAGESDLHFQKMCSDALETESLNARDRAGTYVNRGVMKLRQKAWAPATGDFDTAARIEPNLGETYVNRGAAAIAEHRYSDGLADLNKALDLGVTEPQKAYYNRAIAHEGLDDMKSAYFDYLKAIELSPDWAAPKEQLVRFRVSRRDE
jgi:tetratricopeptide (TPR) repeat protein